MKGSHGERKGVRHVGSVVLRRWWRWRFLSLVFDFLPQKKHISCVKESDGTRRELWENGGA